MSTYIFKYIRKPSHVDASFIFPTQFHFCKRLEKINFEVKLKKTTQKLLSLNCGCIAGRELEVLRAPMSEAKMKSVRLGEKDTSLHSHLASHPVILCDTLVYSLGR